MKSHVIAAVVLTVTLATATTEVKPPTIVDESKIDAKQDPKYKVKFCGKAKFDLDHKDGETPKLKLDKVQMYTKINSPEFSNPSNVHPSKPENSKDNSQAEEQNDHPQTSDAHKSISDPSSKVTDNQVKETDLKRQRPVNIIFENDSDDENAKLPKSDNFKNDDRGAHGDHENGVENKGHRKRSLKKINGIIVWARAVFSRIGLPKGSLYRHPHHGEPQNYIHQNYPLNYPISPSSSTFDAASQLEDEIVHDASHLLQKIKLFAKLRNLANNRQGQTALFSNYISARQHSISHLKQAISQHRNHHDGNQNSEKIEVWEKKLFREEKELLKLLFLQQLVLTIVEWKKSNYSHEILNNKFLHHHHGAPAGTGGYFEDEKVVPIDEREKVKHAQYERFRAAREASRREKLKHEGMGKEKFAQTVDTFEGITASKAKNQTKIAPTKEELEKRAENKKRFQEHYEKMRAGGVQNVKDEQKEKDETVKESEKASNQVGNSGESKKASDDIQDQKSDTKTIKQSNEQSSQVSKTENDLNLSPSKPSAEQPQTTEKLADAIKEKSAESQDIKAGSEKSEQTNNKLEQNSPDEKPKNDPNPSVVKETIDQAQVPKDLKTSSAPSPPPRPQTEKKHLIA